jgi:hypothetical protein
MTRNYNRDRVASVGESDSAYSAWVAQSFGELTVGRGGAERDLLQGTPDALLKGRTFWHKRQLELPQLAREICRQLPGGFFEGAVVAHVMLDARGIASIDEVELVQAMGIAYQDQVTQWTGLHAVPHQAGPQHTAWNRTGSFIRIPCMGLGGLSGRDDESHTKSLERTHTMTMSGRKDWIQADLRCLMCGRVPGRLVGPLPTGDAALKALTSADVHHFAAFRPADTSEPAMRLVGGERFRCNACGGILMMDELERFSTYDDVDEELEQRPRRGRPPKPWRHTGGAPEWLSQLGLAG